MESLRAPCPRLAEDNADVVDASTWYAGAELVEEKVVVDDDGSGRGEHTVSDETDNTASGTGSSCP